MQAGLLENSTRYRDKPLGQDGQSCLFQRLPLGTGEDLFSKLQMAAGEGPLALSNAFVSVIWTPRRMKRTGLWPVERGLTRAVTAFP